jgi:formylglycine-generating enzyme required for sulfatase activity
VTGQSPSQFKGPDDLPVESVSWDDAIAFCSKLSEREGLKPFYLAGQAATSGGDGYRLPTEAEWEYACRAGSTTRYHFGDEAGSLGEYAWFEGNSGARTHPVGQRRPNAFGLFDMHGNVGEWCFDAFSPSPGLAAPPSPDGLPPPRVIKGGAWASDPGPLRSAARSAVPPDHKDKTIGFRIARDAR